MAAGVAGKTPMSHPNDHYIPPVSVAKLESAAAAGEMDTSSTRLLDGELQVIRNRRAAAHKEDLIGLALSGGGIRSACFALGVMQALAGGGFLKRFDYLSTVSGGGYIGSALTWLLNTEHKDRAGNPVDFGLDAANFPYARENRPEETNPWRMLRFLRAHGNYLTPGNGITLTSGIAVVLRGILLNLLVALPIAVSFAWWLLSVGEPPASVAAASTAYGIQSIPDFEGERAAFRLLLLVGLAAAVLFVLLSIAYSLSTYFGFLLLGPVRRYCARRFVEEWIRWPLWITAGTLTLGAIPWIVDAIAGPAHGIEGDAPCIALLYGIVASIAGMIGGAFTFLRSHKAPPVLLASVGAALLLAGFVLVAYGLAYCIHEHGGWRELVMWGALALAIFTGLFVNVNYITLHRFYRDRLMEAFMPTLARALENRTAGAYAATAFNIQDLMPKEPRNAPFHIVNTNMILVDSKVRRWRIRGGDSFILSPLFCGGSATGWVATGGFLGGKLSLATAMAISGAAANPNTGAGGSGPTRSRVVSLVMTLLNVRLGYWVANPRCHSLFTWARNHFVVAAQQILQGHREEWPLLELSDGGHFDNLGLYELVRRRMRVIVLSDGAADPRFEFADLRIAMRRVEEDFGARIDFVGDDPEQVVPHRTEAGPGYPPKDELAKKGFVVGTIHYADGSAGKLFYVKSTVLDRAPVALKAYKAAVPAYPDESTADQFFSEEQVNAYRELGLLIGTTLAGDGAFATAMS